jgi:hypothetical protein
MKTLPVFVPLLNKSFTGELKNYGTAESKEHQGVPQILDSSRNCKMKPRVISKVKSGRSVCSNVLFMNTDPGNKPRSLNPSNPPAHITTLHIDESQKTRKSSL